MFGSPHADVWFPPSTPPLKVGPGAGDFTLDAWVYPNPEGGTPYRMIYYWSNNLEYPDTQWGWWAIGRDLTRLYLKLEPPAANVYESELTEIVPETWSHVAVTVSRQGASPLGTFYLNGMPVGTFSAPVGDVGTEGSAHIGAHAVPPPGCPIGGCSLGILNGRLDELQMFSVALSGDQIAGLFEAGSFGKCKEGAVVPWDLGFCPDDVSATTSMRICNYSGSEASYVWDLAGLGAGNPSACTVGGPVTFVPASGGPVAVPPGECVSIPYSVVRPTSLVPGTIGCYELTVTNTTTGASFGSTGSVWGSAPGDPLCWRSLDTADPQHGQTVAARFTVTNSDSLPRVVTYQIAAVASDMDTMRVAVGLNGLPPGVAVSDTLLVVGGTTDTIAVAVAYDVPDPTSFYFLVLRVNVDGDPELEDVASVTLRMSPGESTALPDCNRNGTPDSADILAGTSVDADGDGVPDECYETCGTTAVPSGSTPRTAEVSFIEALPNPAQRGARLRLVNRTVRSDVTLEIISAGGRRVRTLQCLLPSVGEAVVEWDGYDEGGRRVQSGVYFVRLRSGPEGVLGRFVLLN